MTLPGTYCQDVETFEIFKVSTRLPRREGTKFDALIIQQFAISQRKKKNGREICFNEYSNKAGELF